MTPSNSDLRQSSLLALRPAADMGEAMLPYLATMPELRTKEYQTAFCQRVFMLFNAAIRTPAYHKERIVDRPEDHTHSMAWEGDRFGAGIVVNDPTMDGERGDLGKQYATMRISDDFCLGVSYIHSIRGEERVREYLRSLKIEEIVLIGKKVRTEQTEQAHAAFLKRSAFTYTEPGGIEPLPVRGYVSGNARLLVPDPPSIITDVAQITQWRGKMDEADLYLRFGEEHFGLTPHVCAGAVRNLDMRGYFDFLFETVWKQVGCLELVLFNAVFCKQHSATPIKRFIIPDGLFPAFRNMFTYDADTKHWSIRMEEQEALRRTCSEMFSDHAEAEKILAMTLEILDDNANAASKRRHSNLPKESEVRVQRLFPSPAQQRNVNLQAVDITKDVDRAYDLAKKRGKTSIDRQHPFHLTGKEILAMEKKEIRQLAQRYPAGIEWHTLLLDETPDRVGCILAQLFEAEDALCSGVCAELVVLLLTMDASIFRSDLSIVDALNPDLDTTKELEKQSPQLTAVLKHLSREALHYCTDYCLRTRPSETASDNHKVDDMLAADRDRDNPKEEADKTKDEIEAEADRKIDISIVHLATNYAEADEALPLFNMENWHPYVFGKEKFMGVATVLEVLRSTSKSDLQKTVEYLTERGHCDTDEVWMKILDNIHDRDMTPIEPKPTTLRELFRHTPPELIAGPCLVLYYTELEKAILQFLRDKKFAPDIDALDLPVNVFLDATGEHVASHAAWKTKGVFELFTTELKENIREYAKDHPDESIRELYPSLFRQKGANRVFTNDRPLTARDLPLIATLCQKEKHGLMTPIVRKALLSSGKIQEQLLTETLPLVDAAALACAVLGDHARTASDKRIIGDLQLQTWQTRTAPPLDASSYRLLHSALKKRPPLFATFVGALTVRDAKTPLTAL